MKPHNFPGLFVAFEGIDASGKETQSRMLADALGAQLISFPDYSTPMGALIKSHLQRSWKAWGTSSMNEKLDPMVFQALQVANRMERMPLITSLLEKTVPVIADRYAASGLVYGAEDGINGSYLEHLQSYLPQPDLYFLLDITAEESFRRRPNRGGDRYEEDKAYLERVQQRYTHLFHRNGQGNRGGSRWIALDGTQDPETLHQQVLDHLKELVDKDVD